MGINRFECRTCPYEQPIVRQTIFETTEMKQKEVEDVFGGKEEFANADSVASKLRQFLSSLWSQFKAGYVFGVKTNHFSFLSSTMPRGELQWRSCILLPTADS